jgi:hypothetical protein
MARAILLPLANLDSVFDDLGQLLASADANAGMAEADLPRAHLRN